MQNNFIILFEVVIKFLKDKIRQICCKYPTVSLSLFLILILVIKIFFLEQGFPYASFFSIEKMPECEGYFFFIHKKKGQLFSAAIHM